MHVINAKVAQVFEINLDESPSTGYIWLIRQPASGISVIDAKFEAYPKHEMVCSAGGCKTFKFVPLCEGTFTMVIELRRPWETEAIETKEFKICVTYPC